MPANRSESGREEMRPPKCFISYSWDNIQHKMWVRRLAEELVKNGVDTSLDQWDCHPGIDLTKYVETCIRESDFVILICTPNFARKSNIGHGGVGYEKIIVTGEIFEQSASPKKYIPVLRSGEAKTSLPSYLKSKIYVDFRSDEDFDQNLIELLRHFHKAPRYKKPKLGSKPAFDQTPKNNVMIDDTFKKTSQSDQLVKRDSSIRKTTTKPETFVIFRDAFVFASKEMRFNPSRAKAFANHWVENFSDVDFVIFRDAFVFASKEMRLNSEDAENFAFEQIAKQ